MYNKRTVFWFACLGMLLFGICLITLGAVTPDLKVKYGLDEVSAGTLFSILPLGILAGSLLFGPVCDRYGYKMLLFFSTLLLSAGFEGLAFSPSSGWLKLWIFFIGLGGGAINGATNAVVSDISDTNKGAKLSLLGVFFGIGALGMPLLLSALRNIMEFNIIIAVVGGLTLLIAILFLAVKFPPAKHNQKLPVKEMLGFFSDPFILLIAFFLFFQSSFEALINNWTTSYLMDQYGLIQSRALVALSLFVAGMSVMRLLLGSIFKNLSAPRLIIISFTIIPAALLIITAGQGFIAAAAGLFLLGAGLAGGFPVMLSFVGDRYRDLPGTAFSFVFTIGLLGNMLINYLMGNIAGRYGIGNLTTVAFIEMGVMILLSIGIVRKLKH